MTHELFLHALRTFTLDRLNDASLRARLNGAKLLYGTGSPGLRGQCVYGAWRNERLHDVIEICAFGEESQLQLAGTALHEFGHCLAEWKAGHGIAWKQMANHVGLRRALASGQHYRPEDFHPEILTQLMSLGPISDGQPAVADAPQGARHCPLGIGTRNGKSRGVGSGSRLRLFTCTCEPPVKVRVARNEFHARCTDCNAEFKRTITTNGNR